MSCSVNSLFKCPETLKKLNNCGCFSRHLDHFAEWMAKDRFSDSTMRFHISNVAHFSNFLKGGDTEINNLDCHIRSFFEHIPTCHCKGWKKPRKIKYVRHSLNRFKTFLFECGKIQPKPEDLAYAETHNEYLVWLSEKFFLKNSSVKLRSSYLKQFLQWYGHFSKQGDLNALTAHDVESFYIKATRPWSAAYRRSLQGTLRSFFDFCHERKHTSRNLRFCLPVFKTYRLSDVPRKIDEKESVKLVSGIDRSGASGKRTYAILRILDTYGVRGCQLRSLKLNDVDWQNNEIHFPPAKNGKSLTFPLTAEVGNAILDYLKNARQKCGRQELFLTLRAPLGPLTHKALSQMIRTAMLKSDIDSPRRGAHCFRHGFVSRMIEQGESFKHIADLAGHKHIQTTFLYTKIDFNSLAAVALELPEVRYENN